MQEYHTLLTQVNAANEEVVKHDAGNKTAGTRVRKAMQEVISAAKAVRVKILEDQKAKK